MKTSHLFAFTTGFVLLTSTLAVAQSQGTVISQKKRKYAPGAVTIKAGQSIKIMNDDLFLHHAFVDADNMEFDSGSMERGDAIDILFKEKGAYEVLCAIHPKMKLDVTVK